MKRITSLILLIAMLFSMQAAAVRGDIIYVDLSGKDSPAKEIEKVKGFDDVEIDHWAYSDIMKCAEKGAINGTRSPDENGIGSFSPKAKVTKGTFIAILARLICPEKITGTAKPGESWATPYYKGLCNARIIRTSQSLASSFDIEYLDDNISRQDMAYLLVKSAEYMGEKLAIDEYAEESIRDFSKTSILHEEYVLKAYSNGLITGYDNDFFGPKDTMTREQMATVVCRLMKYSPRPKIDFKAKIDALNALGDYLVTTGRNKGMVKPEVQKEIAAEIFRNVWVYENSRGELCFKANKIQLPQVLIDAGWYYSVDITPFDTKDMFFSGLEGCGATFYGSYDDGDSVDYVVSGETAGEDDDGHVLKLKEVTWVDMNVILSHKDYGSNELLITFKSTSETSDGFACYYRNSSLSAEFVEMDMTPIYAGIK